MQRAPSRVWAPLAVLSLVGLAALTTAHLLTPPPTPPSSVVSARPSPSLVVAVRDLARLETTVLHVEKVIDLSDRQSRFFGLVEATDALLLVAAGDVILGVDLHKIADGEVTFDAETGKATMRLPSPEVLSSRLDERATYVYSRKTELFAKRNEQLEARARQEALAAIEKAAIDTDATGRARHQAERQLRALATQLGVRELEITWR